jgi:transcription antitermination protein NusB
MSRQRKSAGTYARFRDRSTARLAAVQALYQMQLTGAKAASIIEEFSLHRLADIEAGGLDRQLFAEIVSGVEARRAALEEMIEATLVDRRPIGRLEVVLGCILRAGAYELAASTAVPARVVIDEYLQIAHGFFAGREVALVNAVLDRLARILRAGEVPDAAEEQIAPSA